MNTLTDPLIHLTLRDGTVTRATLPGVLASLMREGDEVVAFPALRPHQRHAWHAFLVQLGTLALLRAGLTEPPDDEEAWRDLLRGLTPDHPDDAPWCLIAPSADRPALLQPPLPGGDLSGLKNVVATPDQLDMLVTSKNHDLKGGVMAAAEADDWLFALVTLQTMEGYSGKTKYGISRMNSGYGNRPGIGIVPPGYVGAHVRRDITQLVAMNGRPPMSEGYPERDGLALVWLQPWDGNSPLSLSVLDPLYIETCRRVRLLKKQGRIFALEGGSESRRLAERKGGVTGDPWAPTERDKNGSLKVKGLKPRGLDYREMTAFMFPRAGQPAPLQEVADDDSPNELSLLVRGLVRGDGRTEGYHERRVPLSRVVRRRGASLETDPVAAAAHERVTLAGEMAGVLRFALLALFENGPDKVDQDNAAAGRKARPFLARFERAVDLTFFENLWREVEQDDQDASAARRAEWVRSLLVLADSLLAEADRAASKATRRRYRARVTAQAVLHGGARRNERLRGYLPQPKSEEAPDAAA